MVMQIPVARPVIGPGLASGLFPTFLGIAPSCTLFLVILPIIMAFWNRQTGGKLIGANRVYARNQHQVCKSGEVR
jgi:hypothetical protein